MSRLMSCCRVVHRRLILGVAILSWHLSGGMASQAAAQRWGGWYVTGQHGAMRYRGRSLRAFDLKQRLFRYPCSYTVHTNLFTRLTPEVKAYVIQQIVNRVSGLIEQVDSGVSGVYQREDLMATLEMLSEFFPDLAQTAP